MTSSSFKVKLAMFAGEILLRNGAEAFRVEDTITRILKHYEFHVVETITTTTGIYVSVVDDEEIATTLIKRIHTRTIDLNKIAEVNSISRKICDSLISPQDAYDRLVDIQNSITYPDHILIIAWAFSSAGFAYVLNSSFKEAFITLFLGFIAATFAIKYCKNMSRIAYPCVVSSFIGFTSIIAATFISNINVDNIIIGGVMPLVPGVASVNAIRDVLNGDYMCAQSRLLDVMVVAICISLGIGFSLSTFLFLDRLV